MKRDMQKLIRMILPAAFALLANGAHAQTMQASHWTPSELQERSQHLRQLAAKEDGAASETLEKYPHHYTMLAFRSKSGGGELHEHFADFFYILEGSPSLVTGGTLADSKSTGPGEERGSGVTGGQTQQLKVGDMVHIPAGVPHQLLVPPGGDVLYFVIKVQESE